MSSSRFTELPRIPVRVGPPRAEGALAATFDGDTVMLLAEVPKGTSSPIGVNVDALVLVDALEDGTVFAVEVLVPQAAWRSSKAVPTPPPAPEQGSIAVADPGPSIYVDRLSPRFTLDSQRRLHVELEPTDSETRWVALSSDCFALVNGGFLAGFVALLPSRG